MMEGSNKWESPRNGGFQKPLRAAKLWREKPRAIPLTRKGCAMASVAPAVETRETRAQRSGVADGIKPGAQPRSVAACEPRSGEPWEYTNNVTPPLRVMRRGWLGKTCDVCRMLGVWHLASCSFVGTAAIVRGLTQFVCRAVRSAGSLSNRRLVSSRTASAASSRAR